MTSSNNLSSTALRKAFGLFATGVGIAATFDQDGDHNAMTINSITSLSLEPPLILFCIDNKSANLAAFKNSKYFALSILAEDQIELSRLFSIPKNIHKWGNEKAQPHSFAKFGSPYFNNALIYFECKLSQIIPAGDHHIIIGEIVDFQPLQDKPPLLYFASGYRKLQDKSSL